jgi:hypothetical protein
MDPFSLPLLDAALSEELPSSLPSAWTLSHIAIAAAASAGGSGGARRRGRISVAVDESFSTKQKELKLSKSSGEWMGRHGSFTPSFGAAS